jgi:predicted dienelactone hydrolase
MSALLALLLTAYDPLAVAAPGTVLELKAGELPVRVFLPAATTPAPVILFSHGLGGSREGNAFLGEHWAKRGYIAVFLQHPGSDGSVWRDKPQAERMAAMKAAASLENFMARVDHVKTVLDALTKWNSEEKHALNGRLDLTKLGMSGHSFGAVTTQAVSGQQYPLGKNFTDARIKSAMALSPSLPKMGKASTAFGKVSIPWLLMTGTADVGLLGGQTPESRRAVYPELPAGQKYQLVLEGAEHSAFTDRALPGDSLPRNPNHHRAVLAISTAFFDSTLKGDKAAREWLEGKGAKSVLEAKDLWQWK